MANNMIACRKSFTDTLLELARQDKDIVAVTTDARGSTGHRTKRIKRYIE